MSACGAVAYVMAVAAFFKSAERLFGNEVGGMLVPIGMLLLLVVSVSVMEPLTS